MGKMTEPMKPATREPRQPAAFHGPAGISIAPARFTAAELTGPLPCG